VLPAGLTADPALASRVRGSRRAALAIALLASPMLALSCSRATGPPAVTDLPSADVTPARLGSAAAGDLTVTGARLALPSGTTTSAGTASGTGATIELTIVNTARATAIDDALIGVRTNLGDARLVPARVPIAAGGSVTLTSGGAGPSARLPAGAHLVARETAAVTLVFVRAGELNVFATVE